MRQLAFALLATTALSQGASAADLPRRAPVYKAPVAPVVLTTWTGCYIGGNVGYAWAKKKYSRPSDGANDGFHTADGFAGGGQIGCDYQFANNFVFGVQGMLDWADLDGAHAAILTTRNEATRVSWFATATARLGITVTPSVLAYVKGGAAWVHDKHTRTDAAGAFLGSVDVTRNAWTIGGGLEWMFVANWSVFAEYNYMDFGTKRFTFRPVILTSNIDQNVHTALVGVNYRFFR